MRTDFILLDDDLEIMVIPHIPEDRKWLTYDEVDEMRKIFPRFPAMIQAFNDMGNFVERIEGRDQSEKSD
jgi:hypothetical protein